MVCSALVLSRQSRDHSRKSSQVFPDYSRDLAKVHGVGISDHISELAGKVRTFIHGNLRADNVFFGTENGSRAVALIDWQVKGIACVHSDEASFLAASITTRVRRVIEHPVIVEPADIVHSRELSTQISRTAGGPPKPPRKGLFRPSKISMRRNACRCGVRSSAG